MSERYVLDATNKSITAVMSGAAATTNPDFEATWADKTTTTFTPGGTDGAFNGATPVTIVASPAASTQRTIYSINIYNRDTAAVTIELRYVNGASTRVIKSITLAVGDQCTLDGTYDDEGNLKTVLSGVGSGTVTSVSATATPTGVFDVNVTNPTTTPAIALTMDNQTGNTVLASPANGSSGQPAFRALVDDDIPAALTLVGGTANNMPIGGSTPNAGTFTTAIADLLRLSASTILTLATGAVTATKSYHIIAAESGTADDLVTITAAGDRQFLVIQADAGDTITIKHGTGNIFLNGAADFAMSGDETVLLFYDGTNWSDVGIGGGGGSGITELTGDVTAGPGSGSVAATLVSGTNATLTTPKIITSINDTNGNEMLSLTATGSAVNNIALTNAATGGTPTIAAVGSDADVSIDLQPKGAGVIIAESALNMNDKQIQKALYADLKAAAAPSNPSAGYIRVYADSGNSNHVTQRDSAGTVIDLAASGSSGAMTQLVAWTVLGADTASVSMSSISGSYSHLFLTIRIRTDHSASDDALVRFNADTTAGNYYGVFAYVTQTTTGAISNAGSVATITPIGGWVGANTATASYYTDYFIWIMDYTSTSRFKIFNMLSLVPITTTNFNHVTGGGQWLNSANAITAISIAPRNGSNLKAGTGYGLWGIV